MPPTPPLTWSVQEVESHDEHIDAEVKVLISKVEPKKTNSLIKELSENFPLHGMHHLKRVRRTPTTGGNVLEIIICVAEDQMVDGSKVNFVPQCAQEIVSRYNLTVYQESVPARAAVNKEEWNRQCKKWPTSFHPTAKQKYGDSDDSSEESALMYSFMMDALKQAQEAWIDGNAFNGAVIVDPLAASVVACGRDATAGGQPREQGSIPDCFSSPQLNKKADDIKLPTSFSGIGTEFGIDGLGVLWHPLGHAVMNAINSATKTNVPSSVLKSSREGEEWHLKKRAKMQEGSINDGRLCTIGDSNLAEQLNSDGRYLWTGFDVYVVHEPCTMCAMALVHQRVRRVIYAFSSKHGALGSKYSLQHVKGLNHHYQVLKAFITRQDFESILK